MADEIYPNFSNISNSRKNFIFLPHAQLCILIMITVSKQIEEKYILSSPYFTFYYTLYGKFGRYSLYI